MESNLLKFTIEDSVTISGRGLILTGHSPTDIPNPAAFVGTLIEADGKAYRVLGVERHPLPRGIRQGDPVGFLVEPA